MNITEEQFLNALEIVKKYRDQCAVYLDDANAILGSVSTSVEDLKYSYIRNMEIEKTTLSERAKNGVRALGYKERVPMKFVKDLIFFNEYDLRRVKNIGNATIKELKLFCESAKIEIK